MSKPASKAAPKPAAAAKKTEAPKPAVARLPVSSLARPQVAVRKVGSDAVVEQVVSPAVLIAPIRPDIVQKVHTDMSKNARQAYAVSPDAGMQHSAHSWGTGRAVARIPRVSGGGTSRSGQGAFGNMCRKGRMFAPTKTWRRWHRKINTNQKRFAVASALAASALPSLVFARGHRISAVPEVPLVLESSLESVTKTKDAIKALQAVGAYADVEKVQDSKTIRAGKGKMRGRRYVQRRGPLLVYNKDNGIVRAFRNLPGVELTSVDSLNLLQLAPGGHLGRFVIWTKDAFLKLNSTFGSFTRLSATKKGYHLPRAKVTNSDIGRIINSDEVQSVVRAAKRGVVRRLQKKNPLTNLGARIKLNPYAAVIRRAAVVQQQRKEAKVDAFRQKQLDNAKKAQKKHNKTNKANNYRRLVQA